MSDSLELFMEDISLLPGWILRNLSLMREIDLKGSEAQSKLDEKKTSYLKEIEHLDQPDMEISYESKLNEIKNLQKEIRSLLKEKLAISDQSIHFIRYDGEILRKYFEQLGETLTENSTGVDHNNGSNYSGRISISDNCRLKNTNRTAVNTEVNLFSFNGISSDRINDSFTGNSLNNSKFTKSQYNNLVGNNSFQQLTIFNSEYFNKSKKRKTSTTNNIATKNTEITSKSPKNSLVEFQKAKSKSNNLIERKCADFQICSICEGSESSNNKILSCGSCSENLHFSCLWTKDPNLCKECSKKQSIPIKGNYEIGYLLNNANTTKSDQTKTSKTSKKK
ncbi:hypothetical protein FG386_002511 [Cryptosporidium ryanae]|uniref:uncharacterized protein n=1 Tax=Cryptosporidium ryanae TaxID=515981 RepID=UPI00351A8DBE|nr:hypothetical protein FG386_002511 [Cryptosporidium ryanae]